MALASGGILQQKDDIEAKTTTAGSMASLPRHWSRCAIGKTESGRGKHGEPLYLNGQIALNPLSALSAVGGGLRNPRMISKRLQSLVGPERYVAAFGVLAGYETNGS